MVCSCDKVYLDVEAAVWARAKVQLSVIVGRGLPPFFSPYYYSSSSSCCHIFSGLCHVLDLADQPVYFPFYSRVGGD